MKRYLLIDAKSARWNGDATKTVAAYLPANYSVLGETTQGIVVGGEDSHGWTLDAYVIPRLNSGLIWATEIDLSHPAMKEIRA